MGEKYRKELEIVEAPHDTVFLQQASGKHTKLLKVTQEHHRAYAEKWNMDYWCIYGRSTQWQAYWEKMFLSRQLLQIGYKYIIYLDADTVIVDTNVNLKASIRKPMMMVRHPGCEFGGRAGHWNCGVLFIENCEAVKKFIDDVIAHGPGFPDWWEQTILNHLLTLPWYKDLVGELDVRYNSTYKINEAQNPIIKALHGPSAGDMNAKERLLREWLKS